VTTPPTVPGPGYPELPDPALGPEAPYPPLDYQHPPWYQGSGNTSAADWQPPTPPKPTTARHRASPPRGQRRRFTLLGVGAVVLAVGAAGAIYAAASGGSGGSSSAAATGGLKTLWAIPGTKGTATGTGLAGSWITANAVVDARSDGTIAYALRDGAQLWNWQVPAGMRGCGMSSAPVGGVGVLAYGADANHCDQLIGLSADHGTRTWGPISLADASSFPIPVRNPHIAAAGTVLAVQGPASTIATYDLASGAKRWSTPRETSLTDDTCSLADVQATTTMVYGLYQCDGASGSYAKLVGYDAATGRQAWTGNLPTVPAADAYALSLWTTDLTGAAGAHLLAVDATPKHQSVYAFTDTSTKPIRVDISGDDYNAFSTTGQAADQRRAHGYSIVGHTLYIQTAAAMHGIANGVTAIDLSTGQILWTQTLPDTATTIVGADARGLHAVLQVPGEQSRYQLAVYDLRTGKVSRGPDTADNRFVFTTAATVYLSGDYLALLPSLVLSPQTPELVVLAGASR
jgi:hypothetical protein